MSFRNCKIQPWWHSWIATHRVVQLADVINLQRHGLILSVLLPSEKSECTKDSIVVRIARMIATAGATRRDSSSCSTKGNKANIGIGKFSNCQGDPKKLWRSLSLVLRKEKPKLLDCEELSAERFSEAFQAKLDRVCSATAAAPPTFEGPCCLSNLEDFKLLDDAAVRRFISSAACKFCELDPASTWIIKKYAN